MGPPQEPSQKLEKQKDPSQSQGPAGLHPRRVISSCRNAKTQGNWELPLPLIPPSRLPSTNPGPRRSWAATEVVRTGC